MNARYQSAERNVSVEIGDRKFTVQLPFSVEKSTSLTPAQEVALNIDKYVNSPTRKAVALAVLSVEAMKCKDDSNPLVWEHGISIA